MDMAEYLEEDEVQKLVESAPTIQKKAFLAVMYESGARPEEFLRLTNADIRIDSKGAVLMLRGKTGERRVRIISFSRLFQQWLEIHPLRNHHHYPIWISEATNFKNKSIGLRGAEKIIEQALAKSGLRNKHARLYILRHSRATHLAKHLTEAQMCTFFRKPLYHTAFDRFAIINIVAIEEMNIEFVYYMSSLFLAALK